MRQVEFDLYRGFLKLDEFDEDFNVGQEFPEEALFDLGVELVLQFGDLIACRRHVHLDPQGFVLVTRAADVVDKILRQDRVRKVHFAAVDVCQRGGHQSHFLDVVKVVFKLNPVADIERVCDKEEDDGFDEVSDRVLESKHGACPDRSKGSDPCAQVD